MNFLPVFNVTLIYICLQCFVATCFGIEQKRMEEYYRRGHTWPPQMQEYKPSTNGWKKINEEILEQMQYMPIESSRKRYMAYMTVINSALISKNFTKYGWGITKAPKHIVNKLKRKLHSSLRKEKKRYESQDKCLEAQLLPYFFDNEKIQNMNKEVLEYLLPLHESWAGVELIPHMAYGIRVYRNETKLLMHYDQQDTHVISSILHIDNESDENWPLVIEDFHGNTNEIYLEPGDLLFYESSKCRHGRPKAFKGKFYSSLFLHYYPKNDWETDKLQMDTHFRMPDSSIWRAPIKKNDKDDIHELNLVELCFKEPECEHEWCGLKDSLKWSGIDTEYGKVIEKHLPARRI